MNLTTFPIIRLNPSESEQACREITSTLPEWFGVPEANERYAKGVRERLSFGYMESGNCQGMITLEFPFSNTANIYWIGVRKDSRQNGIGKALLRHAEAFCLEQQIYSLTVETVSPKAKDENYLETFKFYLGIGFKPLFELNTYGPDYPMVYLNKMISPQVFKWIDLTHKLSEKIPTWNGDCGFHHTDIVKYEDCTTECKFLIQRVEMLAGIGTHMDAPAHCFPKGKTITDLPLQSLISPCIILDVSKEAHELYSVDMKTIEKFEKQYGKPWKNSLVIFHTGWDRFWNQREKYHNNYRFPSVTKQVAEYLLSQDIAGIGIDTLSPDRPDSGFAVHQILLGANKYIVENIANASQMPTIGGYAFVIPLPIVGSSEAPVHLLGTFPA